jgi:calpain-15
LWVRMLSFVEVGFLMGVATSQGGDGLVGGHAYSVLDVIEVRDSIVGEQSKVTDFFCRSPENKKSKVDPSDKQGDGDDAKSTLGERTTVRLVRIRNPWGTKEWKGDWSADSERWTKALRQRLGSDTFAKGDGTFFMSYDDMLERFHHMDVAKTREVGY